MTMVHPKGLYLLFTVEMWERFSYYGMRALLIFYLTKSYVDGGLGFSEQNASLIYGLFTGLVYFTPIFGGFLADRFLGQRLSIAIGGFTMMLGQFCLASGQNVTSLFLGLGLLIIGNGFFKPNISVIVGQLYSPDDKRRDSAFTIFYMGINAGALIAPFVTGFLALHINYNAGFLAAGVGMLLGQVFYLSLGSRLLGDKGKRQNIKHTPTEPTSRPLTDVEKSRTKVILIITFFVVFFFAGFEQAGSSLSLFADKYINRNVLGFEVPASWFQSVNPIFIVVLAPLISSLWGRLAEEDREPSIPIKMAMGMILLGIGFLFMVGAALSISSDGGRTLSMVYKASILWIIFTYFTHTVGELCLSPIGLSMVSRLAPVKLASLLMGIWLMSSFFANLLAGFIASRVGDVGAFYTFAGIAAVSVFIGIVLLVLSPRLNRMMHLEDR